MLAINGFNNRYFLLFKGLSIFVENIMKPKIRRLAEEWRFLIKVAGHTIH